MRAIQKIIVWQRSYDGRLAYLVFETIKKQQYFKKCGIGPPKRV